MDGISLYATVCELQKALVGGRVDKINQPEKDQLIIQIRNENQNYRLLLSASANHCRIHLTDASWSNPTQAPMLCMLFRKLLVGTRLTDIFQHDLERIVSIKMEGTDELGLPASYTLFVEIMGRHSNIILTDDNQKIIDSVKHVPYSVSRVRQILPGLTYSEPPAQDKLNPLHMDSSNFVSLLSNYKSGALDRFLCDNLSGISRYTAQLLVYDGLQGKTHANSLDYESSTSFANYLNAFFNNIANQAITPCLYLNHQQKVTGFAPYKIESIPSALVLIEQSMSNLLEKHYLENDKKDRIEQKAQSLLQALTNRLDRSRSRYSLHQNILSHPEKGEEYRLLGELLTANLYLVKQGMKTIAVTNYYSDDGQILNITLDPRLSPSDNAQHYYKLYSKHKESLLHAKEQSAIAKSEIEYFESQLYNISKCTTVSELDEIRLELENAGILSSSTKKRKKQNIKLSKPLSFLSSDGFEMRVGKNNMQNDTLTMKWANSADVWLHAKDMPGSHVIIRTHGENIPDQTLLEAATLAAINSSGSSATSVPIDYTLKKYVKKPVSAKPGMVIYTHQKTLIIHPDEKVLSKVKSIE